MRAVIQRVARASVTVNAAVVGLGLAVLPCFMASEEGTLRRVSGEVLGSRAVWLVFHPDLAKVARVRAVIDFVTAMLAAEAALLRG